MATKAKRSSKARKSSAGKKTIKKKVAKKKSAVKNKSAAKKASKKIATKKSAKKAVKKAASAKPAAKKALAPARKSAVPRPVEAKPFMVAPGPSPKGFPPVEEPAPAEEAIGTVTHYYSHLGVAVIQVNKGVLRVGDRVHVKGHTSDFSQTIDSLEYEHQRVEQASAGQSVGTKVIDHAREHDIVYRIL
jgi:hypothetical protein